MDLQYCVKIKAGLVAACLCAGGRMPSASGMRQNRSWEPPSAYATAIVETTLNSFSHGGINNH